MMEWARLKSTLIALHNTRFLCSQCLTGNKGNPKLLEKERRIKGCWHTYGEPVHMIDGIKYSTCPGNYYDENCANLIEASEIFDKGVMLYPGAYMEQPAKAIETLRIIRTYKVNYQLERAKQKAASQRAGIKHGR